LPIRFTKNGRGSVSRSIGVPDTDMVMGSLAPMQLFRNHHFSAARLSLESLRGSSPFFSFRDGVSRTYFLTDIAHSKPFIIVRRRSTMEEARHGGGSFSWALSQMNSAQWQAMVRWRLAPVPSLTNPHGQRIQMEGRNNAYSFTYTTIVE